MSWNLFKKPLNAGVGVLAILLAMFGVFFNHVWSALVVPLAVKVVDAATLAAAFASLTATTTVTATALAAASATATVSVTATAMPS